MSQDLRQVEVTNFHKYKQKDYITDINKDMSKKGILVNVEIPIYRITINVLIDKTCKHAIKLSKRLEKEFLKYGDWDNTYGAYLYSKENNIHAIVLSEDCDVETIAHECFHAIMGTLQLKGLKYSQKSEEAFAYVLGYLTKQVCDIKITYDKSLIKNK